MATFVVDTPHTPAECMRALDEMASGTKKLLPKMHFACNFGEHRGWAIVNARNEESVKAMIPGFLRSKAKVQKVKSYTLRQAKAMAAMH